jgi:hypothetical protein
MDDFFIFQKSARLAGEGCARRSERLKKGEHYLLLNIEFKPTG